MPSRVRWFRPQTYFGIESVSELKESETRERGGVGKRGHTRKGDTHTHTHTQRERERERNTVSSAFRCLCCFSIALKKEIQTRLPVALRCNRDICIYNMDKCSVGYLPDSSVL